MSCRELTGFTAACLRLHFKLAGPFDQVDVFLCEDNQTIGLMAYDANGQFATASYELDQKVSADFDLSAIRAAFN